METNYYCADLIPDIDERYVTEAIFSKYTLHHQPNDLRANSSFNSTEFMRLLQKNLGRVSCLYLKNPPSSLYDWHIDRKEARLCSINIPIRNENSYAYFRELIPGEEGKRSIMYKLDPVKYVLYKPTVLNVSNEHCVINNSDKERIILSLSVHESTFDQTVDYLKKLNDISMV